MFQLIFIHLCNEGFPAKLRQVRDGFELAVWMLWDTGITAGRTCPGVSSVEHRLTARHSLLNARGTGSFSLVSRTVDQQAGTLEDLELSCLFVLFIGKFVIIPYFFVYDICYRFGPKDLQSQEQIIFQLCTC